MTVADRIAADVAEVLDGWPPLTSSQLDVIRRAFAPAVSSPSGTRAAAPRPRVRAARPTSVPEGEETADRLSA